MNLKETIPVRALLPEKSQTQSLTFDEHVELHNLYGETFFPMEISVAACNEYDEKYKTNIQGKLERYPRELLSRLTPLFNSKRDLLEKAANCDFNDTVGIMNFFRSMGTIANYLLIFNFKLAELPDKQSDDPLDKEIVSFVNFGENLIHKNFGRLETTIERNTETVDTGNAYRVTRTLLDFTAKEEIKKDCLDFMLRNIEKSTGNIKEYFGEDVFVDCLIGMGFLYTLMDKGDNSQMDSAKDLMIKMLKDDDVYVSAIAQMELMKYWNDNPETSLVEKIAREGFNTDMKKIVPPKQSSAIHGDILFRTSSEGVFDNFRFIQNLEKERPGITEILREEFGIIHFTNYPEEILVDQYNEFLELRATGEIKNSLPSIMIIDPQDDYYETFGSEKNVYKDLYNQIKGKARIRIYQIGDIKDSVRVFRKSRRNYGLISLPILGGYGYEDGIGLNGEESGFLNIELLETKTAKAIKQTLIKNPTIILNSCLGAKLGQKISEIYDATVLAPDQEIMKINEITAKFLPDGGMKVSNLSYEALDQKTIIGPDVFIKGKHLPNLKIIEKS